MNTYKPKDIQIQAFQLTRDVVTGIPDWFVTALDEDVAEIDEALVDGAARMYGCTVRTPQGRMKAKIGDYITRDPDGTLSVYKDTKFRQLYEEVTA